jgi:hypothetical protein
LDATASESSLISSQRQMQDPTTWRLRPTRRADRKPQSQRARASAANRL